MVLVWQTGGKQASKQWHRAGDTKPSAAAAAINSAAEWKVAVRLFILSTPFEQSGWGGVGLGSWLAHA